MADPGSFAERVKNQADIVRVVGEHVRLKKSGQNFMGLCPFHAEKSPSFSVHPVKQFYHCFGCGVSGDVFKFVMETEKLEFPEAVRAVAEKCGIPIPKQTPRTPEERRAQQQRPVLVELHKDAARFFREQLEAGGEGRAARAYLEERGLTREVTAYFGIGYAPAGGDALVRALGKKYGAKAFEAAGLMGRDQSGRAYDRFRRRIMFPIASVKGDIIAFGGRAMGDDLPKYLNSPETAIYKKSETLYNLDRAKLVIKERGYAVLVEGYMDAIAVMRAGVTNVVASCGTALTNEQIKLLARFAENRVVVNFDPDAAGQAATERSLALLLEHNFDVRVLALPAGGSGRAADPDLFIRQQGAEAYQKLLQKAPPYVDYLITRAKRMDSGGAEGKLRAVNFLMPYVQRVPDRLLRSEWATRIAAQLQIEEPVLRESVRKAAAERRSEVKPKLELLGSSIKPAERRLMQMLLEGNDLSREVAEAIRRGDLHLGLENEKIFAALLHATDEGARPDPAVLADYLEEKDRRVFFQVAFEPLGETTPEEAESCLAVLRRRHIAREMAAVQKEIAASAAGAALRKLLTRKQELHKLLKDLGE
jgi:DNA primase